MTRNNSLANRYHVYLNAAALAAHASHKIFRQRDLKFYTELFSNWLEINFHQSSLLASNTQIMRFISSLVNKTYATKVGKSKNPSYKLTKSGIMELAIQLVSQNYCTEREEFFFVYYFIKNYQKKIIKMIETEEIQQPKSYKINLSEAFDVTQLLEREIKNINLMLRKIEERINDAIKTADFTQKALKAKEPFQNITKKIEKLYPYEFNSQKPLSELIFQLDPEQRQWELEVGVLQRVQQLWLPQKRVLELYQNELLQLKNL